MKDRGFFAEMSLIFGFIAVISLIAVFCGPPLKYAYGRWDRYWNSSPVKAAVEKNVGEQF